MSRFIRLYPKAWRDRYGDEMVDLLAARPATNRDRVDLVRGAVDARLHPARRDDRPELVARALSPGDARMVRRLGIATAIGAAVWPVVLIVALAGPVVYDGYGGYRDGSGAFPVAILAVALLVAGLIGQVARFPDELTIARVAAGAAIPFVLLWVMAPWVLWLGGIALLLITAMAIAARYANAWPTRAVVSVVASSIGIVGLTGFAVIASSGDRLADATFVYLGVLVLIPIWATLGWTLLLDDRGIALRPATPAPS